MALLARLVLIAMITQDFRAPAYRLKHKHNQAEHLLPWGRYRVTSKKYPGRSLCYDETRDYNKKIALLTDCQSTNEVYFYNTQRDAQFFKVESTDKDVFACLPTMRLRCPRGGTRVYEAERSGGSSENVAYMFKAEGYSDYLCAKAWENNMYVDTVEQFGDLDEFKFYLDMQEAFEDGNVSLPGLYRIQSKRMIDDDNSNNYLCFNVTTKSIGFYSGCQEEDSYLFYNSLSKYIHSKNDTPLRYNGSEHEQCRDLSLFGSSAVAGEPESPKFEAVWNQEHKAYALKTQEPKIMYMNCYEEKEDVVVYVDENDWFWFETYKLDASNVSEREHTD